MLVYSTAAMMQWILFFASILFVLQSNAEELAIRRGPKGELVLSGKSCQELNRQQAAICEWKKILEPGFTPGPQVTCKTSSQGRHSITISNCLPDFTRAYHQVPLTRSGPNCWGTALSFKGISSKPRFAWPEEIEYWMNSPLCRKLEVGEEKKPGDIINGYYPEYQSDGFETIDEGIAFWNLLYPGRYHALRDAHLGYTGYHAPFHAVTYLSPELVFGKDGPSKDDRFYFHPLKEMYGRSTERDCQENQTLKPYFREYDNAPKNIRESKCAYFSVVYRCNSLPQFLSSQSLSPENAARWKQIQELQAIQAKLFPLVIQSGYSLSTVDIEKMMATTDAIIANDQVRLRIPADKTSEMLLVLEYFTASGIQKSLKQAKFRIR